MGVGEDAVREKLLEDKKLDLAKCLELGRAYETSRQQSQSMSKSELRYHKCTGQMDTSKIGETRPMESEPL